MYKILCREWSLGKRALLVVFIINIQVQIPFLQLKMYPHKKKMYRRYWSTRFVVYFDSVIDGWVGMWSFWFCSVWVGAVFVWIGNREKRVFYFYVTRNRRNVQDFCIANDLYVNGHFWLFSSEMFRIQIPLLHLNVSTKKRYTEDIEVLDLLFTLMAL